MLQLIGWLGCVYLAVKLLGMAGNKSYRKDDGEMDDQARGALWIGWISVGIFALAFWLVPRAAESDAILGSLESTSSAPPSNLTPEQVDCVNSAQPGQDVLDCVR